MDPGASRQPQMKLSRSEVSQKSQWRALHGPTRRSCMGPCCGHQGSVRGLLGSPTFRLRGRGCVLFCFSNSVPFSSLKMSWGIRFILHLAKLCLGQSLKGCTHSILCCFLPPGRQPYNAPELSDHFHTWTCSTKKCFIFQTKLKVLFLFCHDGV